ncbi:MAG: collagen-binding domain-containing protein [Coprococcus sp.]
MDIDLDGDINNRRIAVNGDGMHVVSLDYNELSANTNPIYFEFPDCDGDTVLLMNIDLSGAQDVVFGDMILGSKNDARQMTMETILMPATGCILTFMTALLNGQFSGGITFAGRGFGTVMAPKASVNLGHNWDGCVVSEIFSNSGEFHRVPELISQRRTDN